MTESSELSQLEPRAWLHHFRAHFDASASDPGTELGVFYERHRNYLQYEQLLDSERIEYTDSEWTQVLSSFFSRLAREFGLYQARDRVVRPELAWFRPGGSWRLAVIIRQANIADDTILSKELPALVDSGADLSVLMIYPDYPPPNGTSTIEEATQTWKARIAAALSKLSIKGRFLLITIGANEWQLPAPWQGFVWNREPPSLESADGAGGPETYPVRSQIGSAGFRQLERSRLSRRATTEKATEN